MQLIFILFVFVGILVVTYYVTKWIAGFQKSQGFNHNLEIVEAIRLTNNKFIQIVRAGSDRYFILAIGKDEITLIGELTEEELIKVDDQGAGGATYDFKAILDKVIKTKK